tara:strand:- start:2045 stop:2395 length:351 start_codon:yes stop_codon:yes gene_type:complete
MIKVGNKYKAAYPFKFVSINTFDGVDEFWVMGCNISSEDDGSGYTSSNIFTCDGAGEIEFEVLAVVDMPRKYKSRVIYKFNTTDPDGVVKKKSKDYTVTIGRFVELINRPYRADWE